MYLSFHAVGLSPKNIQPRFELATSEVTCISSWQDLAYILQKDTKRAPLFPASRSLHPLLLIHIHKDGKNISDACNSSNYCQLSELDDKCTVVAVYSQTIFDVYPAALLVSITLAYGYPSALLQYLQDRTMTEISWTLPMPFCSGQCDQFDILEDYVYHEVSGVFVYYIYNMLVGMIMYCIISLHALTLQLTSASDNSPADNYVIPFSGEEHYTWSAVCLYLIIFCSSSAILLGVLRLKNRYAFHHQRSLNSVSKSLLFSAMLQSWIWFVYLYGYQFWGLSLFKDYLHRRSAVVSMAYMPFVDIGYYASGIMGVLYLVEFPFLLWYISTKVMGVDRRGLNRKQCMLNMMKSVGCAGMVLFMQVASWYLVYFIIGFLAYPLLLIVALGAYLTSFIFFTATTALLFLPCLTPCRRCPQQIVPIVFLVLITFICGGFTFLLGYVLEGKWHTSYNSNQIISGLFASGILALLGYGLKSVFAQNTLTSGSQVGTDDESDEQLLQSV